MQRWMLGIVLLTGQIFAGSASAACRTVSVWDSRTGTYHYEQRCDNVVRERRRVPVCRTVSVWDSRTGTYHYEQRCD